MKWDVECCGTFSAVGRLVPRDVECCRTFNDMGRLLMGSFASGTFRALGRLVRRTFTDGTLESGTFLRVGRFCMCIYEIIEDTSKKFSVPYNAL